MQDWIYSIANEEARQNILDACNWSNVAQGRAKSYVKLLKDFPCHKTPSRESLLCTSDVLDIIDAWKLWKYSAENFPGIREKVGETLRKGPLLTDDENVESSNNRPRNDLFVFIFAGKLIRSGIDILSIDKISRNDIKSSYTGDIIVQFEDAVYGIECKRPQKLQNIGPRAKEARKQLHISRREGFLAFECSRLIRKSEKLFAFKDDAEAQKFLTDQLEKDVAPQITSHIGNHVLGAFLILNVPGMKSLDQSPILGITGSPFQHFKQYRVSTSIIVSPMDLQESHPLLKRIYNQFVSTPGPYGFVER